MIQSNKNSKHWFDGFIDLVKTEYIKIGSSAAMLLLLIGGIFIYGFLYNLMYLPNLVREAPFIVVNHDYGYESRTLIRLIDATPQLKVMYNTLNMLDAEQLIREGDGVGALYIPHNYNKNLNRDEQSRTILYANTATFLYYEAMQKASSGTMLAMNEKLRPQMVAFEPFYVEKVVADRAPINVHGEALYNPTMGYGKYLLPAVLILILFQTMAMAIAMSLGGQIFDGSLARLSYGDTGFKAWFRVVLGYTVVYFSLYILFSIFMVGFIPLLFGLPTEGNVGNIMAMMVPFLLGTCFFSIALSVFYSDKDQPLLLITFFSVPLVFLSGVSYPLELMPWYWQWAHFIFPAAPGALAFVKINSMAASLYDVRIEYITMWIQCLVYFILACLAIRTNIKRSFDKNAETMVSG